MYIFMQNFVKMIYLVVIFKTLRH